MYSLVLGRFIQRDPIEADANLYRYAGNTPINSTDPEGLVELELNPEDPDSMTWTRETLSGAAGGNTHVKCECLQTTQKDRDTGKCRERYKLKMTATIQLDVAKIKKDKKLTLATAYGHEQRHVQNVIAIMKKAQETLATIEGKEFETVEEARAAGVKYCKYAQKWISDKVEADRKHVGTDPVSPKNGVGYPPIGTMPNEPTVPKNR